MESNTPKKALPKLVSPRQIRDAAGVSGRTVRRWAKQFDWPTHKVNERVLRYDRKAVEETIGTQLS